MKTLVRFAMLAILVCALLPSSMHAQAVNTSGITTAALGRTSSTCYLESAASTNATSCKGSAGGILAIHATNTTNTAYYLRMYNLASAPTCSSATGFVETIPIFANLPNGRATTSPQGYSAGIGFCLTGGGSSTDNTAAATGVYITILFQ